MVGRLSNSVRFGLFAQLLLTMLLTHTGCLPGGHTGQEDTGYTSARQTVVTQQIKKRGIRDERVLYALTTVPRHLFVPPAYRDRAYQDEPLPIGQSQTISQPYIVALMSERLDLTGTEKVLEIGTGSGYQAAVLSHLAKQVHSIEILPQLVDTAHQRLQQLGYTNVTVIQADGNLGWDQDNPYDAIIVTAAALHIPPTLIQQLAEGGRMVLSVERNEQQHLHRPRKRNGQIIEEELGLVRFVPLVGGNS